MLPAESPLETDQRDDVVVVRFRDRVLHCAQLPQIEEDFAQIMKQADCCKFVIDFADVEYFPSTGLGTLISIRKTITDNNGDLRLANMSQVIGELFVISGLNHMFTIHDDLEAAIKSLH